MQAKLIRAMSWVRSAAHQGIAPAGTVLDHPDCWQLVRLGYAEPEDDECAARASMTPEMMRVAQDECEMRERGIHPDDRDDYRAGRMVGYNPDGSVIPGPNAEPDGGEESVSLYLPEVFGDE